jgi:hypothetical protein
MRLDRIVSPAQQKSAGSLLAFAVVAAAVVMLVALATASELVLPLSVAIGGSVLSIALAQRPTLLLYLVPLMLSVEYRIELGFFSFTLAEVSAIMVWIVALLRIWNNRKSHLKKIELILLLFTIITAFPGVFLESDTRHALSVYRDFTVPLIFFAGFLSLGLSRQQTVRLVKLFVLVSVASAILGIIQYRTDNYLWFMRPEDERWQSFKTGFLRGSMIGQLLGVKSTLATGLFATTNNFAAYLVIPLILAFALATLPSSSLRERLWWKASFILLLVTLFFTFSRSSLFTFLAAWVFLVWFRRKRRLSVLALTGVVAIGILLIGLVLLSGVVSWDQLGTFRGRGTMFQAGLELLTDHPEALIAGGFTEDYRAHYYGAQLVHNLPLYVILQFGLLTVVSWLLLVAVELRSALKVVHSEDQEIKSLGLALFGGLAFTVFLYAQTTSFVDSVQSSLWLFFWMGIGAHLYRFYQADVLSHMHMASLPAEGVVSSD